jgi:hypothetical protein
MAGELAQPLSIHAGELHFNLSTDIFCFYNFPKERIEPHSYSGEWNRTHHCSVYPDAQAFDSNVLPTFIQFGVEFETIQGAGGEEDHVGACPRQHVPLDPVCV